MSEASKAARSAMKGKISRLLRTDPKMKVDASGYTPPDALDADVQTGARPVRGRRYKRGGKVLAVHGEVPKKHAGRKPRKSGGRAYATPDNLVNRDVVEANEERAGSKHVGAFKKGGKVKHRAMGGPMMGAPTALDMTKRNFTPSLKSGGKIHKSSGGSNYEHDSENTGEYNESNFRNDPIVKVPKKMNFKDYQGLNKFSKDLHESLFNSRSTKKERKSGGKVHKGKGGYLSEEDAEMEDRPKLRMLAKNVGPKGHMTKVYKDRDGEHRVKYFKPDGTYLPKGDSFHYDDRDDAMDTAKNQAEKGFKKGGRVMEHDDEAEDKKLIKKLIKPTAIKHGMAHGGSCRCAKCMGGRMAHGGYAKHRKHRMDGGSDTPADVNEAMPPPEGTAPAPTGPDPSSAGKIQAMRDQQAAERNRRKAAPKKKGGSVSDGELEGTRPTGGRLARKSGGKASKVNKGPTIIHIDIGSKHPDQMGPQGGMPPRPPGQPVMVPPAGMMPPSGPPMMPPMGPQGGPPPMMPPVGPNGPSGGMPPRPPMPPQGPMGPMGRKEGGRVKMYAPKQHGAGGGLGRLQKLKAYGHNAL